MLEKLEKANPAVKVILVEYDYVFIEDTDVRLEDLLIKHDMSPEVFLMGIGFTVRQLKEIMDDSSGSGDGDGFATFDYETQAEAEKAYELIKAIHPDANLKIRNDGDWCLYFHGDEASDIHHYLDAVHSMI